MADIIEINLAVKGDRDVGRAQQELERMRKTLIQVAQAERSGELATGSLAKATGQWTKRIQQATGDMAKATKAVHGYKRALDQMTDRQLSAAAGFAASGKGLRRMEILAQQTGYQLGDLAVQIQGGTNAAVALGQQGSQLLGFFGPAGALAGAGLAIATAFIAPFIKAKKEAEDFEKKSKDISEALQRLDKIRLDNVGQGMLGTIKEAKAEFQALLGMMEQAELSKLKKALKAPFDAVVAELKSNQFKSNLSAQLGASAPGYESKLGLKTQNEALFVAKQLQTLEGKTREELAGQLENITQSLALRGVLTTELQNMLSVLAQQAGVEDVITEQAEKQKDLKDMARAAADKGREMSNAELIVARQLTAEEQTVIEARRISNDELLVGQGIVEAIAGHQEDLVKQATAYGEQLGVGLTRAIQLIQQAKAESTIGLDAFGDFGNWKQGAPSSSKPSKTKRGKSALQRFQEQLAVQRDIIGMTKEEAAVRQALGAEYDTTSKRIIDGLIKQTEEIKRLQEQQKKSQELAQVIGDAFSNSFEGIVSGTMTVKDAFKNMARDIVAYLFKVLVIQRMIQGIGGALSKSSNTAVAGIGDALSNYSANGNAFSRGNLVPFANGGVVGAPTTFGMSGGRTGLMGEAGPEAIMPLKRGKDGKLGVAAEGGATTVVNNINVSGSDPSAVRAEVAKLMPQITNATKAAVIDARRRGGAMRATFG